MGRVGNWWLMSGFSSKEWRKETSHSCRKLVCLVAFGLESLWRDLHNNCIAFSINDYTHRIVNVTWSFIEDTFSLCQTSSASWGPGIAKGDLSKGWGKEGTEYSAFSVLWPGPPPIQQWAHILSSLHFAAVLTQAFFVVLHVPHQIQLQIDFGDGAHPCVLR